MNLSVDALEILLQKMPMGIAVFNRDYTIRQCNDIWLSHVQTVTGQKIDEISLGILLEKIIPKKIADFLPYFDIALEGKTLNQELLPLVSGTKTFYWDVFFSSLREDQKIIGVLMIATDVTQKHQAEVAARTAEQSLLTLMNSLSGMAYRGSLSRSRQMELVNDGAQELTGYLSDKFVEPAIVPYGSLIHEEDQEKIWSELNHAIQSKKQFELLYRIHTAHNEIKWVMERGSGLFSVEGDLIAIEGFISDITERIFAQKILEQRVIDRTQKLSTMYEMMTMTAKQDDLETSLQSALSWVLKAVHGVSGFVQLLDNSQNWLHFAVQSGCDQAFIKKLSRVPSKGTIWGEVLANSSPCAYLSYDLPYPEKILFQEENLHSYVGVPIVAQNHLLGVMSIWRYVAQIFSDSDVALMVATAEQMGATIENAMLRRENERLLVLDERNRLARELHDAVTQSLYSLTLFAEANQRFAKIGDIENVKQYSSRIAYTADHTLKEMRLLLHNLRPSILQNAGLIGALQQRLDAVEKRAGIHTQLICHNKVILPPKIEETLFYIIEEALNNSLKHAKASTVTVKLIQEKAMVILEVSDNGCGFDQSQLPDNGGIGLDSMRERADSIKALFEIISNLNGTTIKLTLDLERMEVKTTSRNLLELLEG